jgi:hypothetical protein
MDLPPALRLMVYDCLDIQTKHVNTQAEGKNDTDSSPCTTSLTLIRHHVPLQILRVCKEIRREAHKDMMRKAQEIREMTPHIIADRKMILLIPRSSSIFTLVLFWLKALKENERASFRDWFSDPSVEKPAAFAALPVSMPQFAEQAGIQLLSRLQRLEYYAESGQGRYGNRTITTTATLFFAVTVKHELRSIPDPPKSWHYILDNLDFGRIHGEWEFPAHLSDSIADQRPGKKGFQQTVLVWNVALDADEKTALKDMVPTGNGVCLLAHLGLYDVFTVA